MNGQNVGLIPEKTGTIWKLRILNLDEQANLFSQKKNSNAVFINSCCNLPIKEYKSWVNIIDEKDVEKYGIIMEMDPSASIY